MIKSPEQKKKERSAIRMILLVSQIGITMMVPVFFCVFIGRIVSDKTGHPILFLLFLFIGILAGFRSSWQIISRFTGLRFHDKADSSGADHNPSREDHNLSGEDESACVEFDDDESEDFKEGGFPP